MGIKRVIWDWNGTLFCDVKLCISIENDILRARGLRLIDSMERYYEVFTFPIKKFYENLGLDFTKESYSELADYYVSEYDKRVAECALTENVEAVLERIKQAGIKQTIISAAGQRSLENQMSVFDINGYFDGIHGIPDDLAESKVDLARDYIAGCEDKPEEIVFVGDTEHDFEVAEAVGCKCILAAVGHHSRKRLEKTGARVADSLLEVAEMIGVK